MFIIQNNELLQQAGAISKLIKTSNKFLFNDGNELSWKLKKNMLLVLVEILTSYRSCWGLGLDSVS